MRTLSRPAGGCGRKRVHPDRYHGDFREGGDREPVGAAPAGFVDGEEPAECGFGRRVGVRRLARDGVGEQLSVVSRDETPLLPPCEAEERLVVAPHVDAVVCRAVDVDDPEQDEGPSSSPPAGRRSASSNAPATAWSGCGCACAYANWPSVAYAAADNLLPDFPLINKSFELCYACADR